MASTYAELQAEIANWLDRDDLTAEIVTCIQLCEARFNRTLWAAEREEAVTLEATAASPNVALPANFSAMRSIHIVGSPLIILEPMALNLLRIAHRSGEQGQPANFAITGGDTLVLGPAPDGDYTIILDYYRTIPALTASNTTNWLLTANPDLYLSAALVEASLLIKDEERARLWEAKTSALIDEIMRAGRYKAHGSPPSRYRAPHVV